MKICTRARRVLRHSANVYTDARRRGMLWRSVRSAAAVACGGTRVHNSVFVRPFAATVCSRHIYLCVSHMCDWLYGVWQGDMMGLRLMGLGCLNLNMMVVNILMIW